MREDSNNLQYFIIENVDRSELLKDISLKVYLSESDDFI